MFTVEISVMDEFVKHTENWCPNMEFRCSDSFGRELPVPCVSGHPCRHKLCSDISLACLDTSQVKISETQIQLIFSPFLLLPSDFLHSFT